MAVRTDDILIKADSRTRSNHKYKFKTIRTSSASNKYSFYPRTIIEWNSTPESNDSKPFWRYVKSKQQDTVGVSPLKVDGQLHWEATDKADVLNKQFKSVFTPQQSPACNLPKLSGPKTPLISPLKISTKGVEKLLAGLNVKKVSGPGNYGIVLQSWHQF